MPPRVLGDHMLESWKWCTCKSELCKASSVNTDLCMEYVKLALFQSLAGEIFTAGSGLMHWSPLTEN